MLPIFQSLNSDGNNNAMGSDIVNSHGAVVTNLLIGDEKRAPYMLNGKPVAVTYGLILERKMKTIFRLFYFSNKNRPYALCYKVTAMNLIDQKECFKNNWRRGCFYFFMFIVFRSIPFDDVRLLSISFYQWNWQTVSIDETTNIC